VSKAIADRTASVYIAEPRVDQRAVIHDCLKALGFKKIKAAGSIKEIISLLEVDETPADWVISNLFSEDKYNAQQLMALAIKHTNLHKMRVSLLLQESEKDHLAKSFELGLLSYHFLPVTRTTLQNQFDELLKNIAKDETAGCMVSASYLRNYLLNIELYSEAIDLTNSLIKIYPKNGELILNLAEAQQMAGKNSEALKTLSQAMHMGPSVAKAAKQIQDVILMEQDQGDEKPDSAPPLAQEFAALFNMKSVVVIDSDSTIQTTLKTSMESIGVKDVQLFSDGQTASDWISKNADKISLIIQEWRILKVSSPALLQRYQEYKVTVPVIIFSALVKDSDKSLLKEMGVAELIQKPLDKDLFLTQVMSVIRKESSLSSYQTVARKIQQAMNAGKLNDARSYFQRLILMNDVPDGIKQMCEAEILLADGDIEKAKALAFEAMKNSGESLRVLNLVGKIFMKQRRFDDAIKCLNKAQEMSSTNLERLCMLAEAQSESGQQDKAQEMIESAKDIDPQSKAVVATEVKVALASNNADKAKSIISNVGSLSEIIAFTNNRAVSLSRQNKVEDAISLYQTALSSLPTNEKELISKINYNLSLSFIRAGDMKKANEKIAEALSVSDSSISGKVKSLGTKLDHAIKKGEVIKISVDQPDEEVETKEFSPAPALLLATDVKPGEMCCHLIFYAKNNENNNDSKNLLAKIPRYINRRQSA
jgi:tetratricopeptide (TPR) repeat protein